MARVSRLGPWTSCYSQVSFPSPARWIQRTSRDAEVLGEQEPGSLSLSTLA